MTVAPTERRTPEPHLHSRELSRRSHEAIQSLAEDLLTVPGFTNAFAQLYFKRHFRTKSGETIMPRDVRFQHDDGFEYLVWYMAEQSRGTKTLAPLVYGHDVTLSLTIQKYDPKKRDDEGKAKRIAKVRLSSYFKEDLEGNVINYGDVAWAECESYGNYEYGLSAFPKIPEQFDFKKPVKL